MPRRRTQSNAKARSVTQVVMLGTGTPGPDPERSGPATAVIVNGTPYLIDFGPGVVRRAAAAYSRGIVAFGSGVANVSTVFLTHLHADHTAGYPDLILTPWIMGRSVPLEVYGPKGLRAMTKHLLLAWQVDISNRLNGLERARSAGVEVNVREIKPGLVYRDENVAVTAFPVRHGELEPAFGFRFVTPDKVIVISGDTAPAKALEENCKDCDILIHEAYSQHTYDRVAPRWQKYRREYHTSSRQLGELAARVNPRLLVLYHRSNPGGRLALANPEGALLDEISRIYKGRVVTAHDLDVY
jgi:ribonuclease BN (tRNA processing enzyme)